MSAASLAADGCHASRALPQVKVLRVVDGDTLEIEEGDRVRLIGVNAPELAKRKSGDMPARPAQPLGPEAKAALERMIGSGGGRVSLQKGVDARDRYGRMLAHAFLPSGMSVEQGLLEQGVAFHVAMAPNLAFVDCLAKAEAVARKAGRGLWSLSDYKPRDARHLDASDLGFQRVQMTVARVMLSSRSWWLLADGELGVQISAKDQKYFDKAVLQALPGRQVVVRGWLVRRDLTEGQKKKGYKPYQFSISHPSMLELLAR